MEKYFHMPCTKNKRMTTMFNYHNKTICLLKNFIN